MNLILISEATGLTGLNRQTIRNWIDKGIIPARKINGTFYVDRDTFESMSGQLTDLDSARKALEEEKARYIRERDEYNQMRETVRDDHNVTRFLSVCVNSGIRTRFFEVILQMLRDNGILKYKETDILTALLNGEAFEYVAERYNVSRERIRQIAEKAVHKCRSLTEDHEDKKKGNEEIEALRNEMDALRNLVYRQITKRDETGLNEVEKRLLRMDRAELDLLLSRKLENEDVSVRALNILLLYDRGPIKTIGELCRISPGDFLRQRNAGKKTLGELTEYLKANGLDWGVDIDKIIVMR